MLQIQNTTTEIKGATVLQTTYDNRDASHVHLALAPHNCAIRIYIHSPAEAREIAQMLRGAADALVDFALTQEQPANFTAAEVRP